MSQSVSWGDYDNDGFLDLFMACGDYGTRVVNHLYRNNLPATGNTNHWLKISLIDAVSNRSAIGATIRVRANIGGQIVWQMRPITSGGLATAGLLAHFGLGDATSVELVQVEWPSGQISVLPNVPTCQTLIITEAPQLRNAMFNGGELQFQVTAHAGMNVIIERAMDLNPGDDSSRWSFWLSRTQTELTMTVTDPDAGGYPMRFYRARAE